MGIGCSICLGNVWKRYMKMSLEWEFQIRILWFSFFLVGSITHIPLFNMFINSFIALLSSFLRRSSVHKYISFALFHFILPTLLWHSLVRLRYSDWLKFPFNQRSSGYVPACIPFFWNELNPVFLHWWSLKFWEEIVSWRSKQETRPLAISIHMTSAEE